jgi:hypothetical protein
MLPQPSNVHVPPTSRAAKPRSLAIPAEPTPELLVELAAWSRNVERLRHQKAKNPVTLDHAWIEAFTWSSFRLDGILMPREHVTLALGHRSRPREFRSRLGQRVRNHAAIVLRLERQMKRNMPLRADQVLGWYALISSGLSTTALAACKNERLVQVVARINAPNFRLGLAVHEIVTLHLEILRDELVPGFNGILARLLLTAHLGRCGLRPVILDPDAAFLDDDNAFLREVMRRIQQAYA